MLNNQNHDWNWNTFNSSRVNQILGFSNKKQSLDWLDQSRSEHHESNLDFVLFQNLKCTKNKQMYSNSRQNCYLLRLKLIWNLFLNKTQSKQPAHLSPLNDQKVNSWTGNNVCFHPPLSLSFFFSTKKKHLIFYR